MRLSTTSLQHAQAQHPGYDRSQITPGIVHLGMGNFHRAHQAVYLDDLLTDDPVWGITGVSLRRPDMQQAMAPQNGLYTVAVRSAEGTGLRIVGAVLDVLTMAGDGDQVMAALCNPATRIVSLTVTEKGYCRLDTSGDLDLDLPAVQADLSGKSLPATVPGLLYTALMKRRAQTIAPFTVLSCDNLPENGQTLARVVIQFACAKDAETADWIEKNVAFPSSMVDRIVPATTSTDRHDIEALTGVSDAWPVVTEPFTQWVIEDHFPAGRPDFAAAGVQMVSDVRPFELMKLRMLNGSHSTLAYLGQLLGLQTVAEAITDPRVFNLISQMMEHEIAPTLALPADELTSYRKALLARFENPTLHHKTAQIAMDGSQKIPQRLLQTIVDRHEAGKDWARLCVGVAAWLAYVGQTQTIDDPRAADFTAIKQASLPDAALFARAMASETAFFGPLASEDWFTDPVIALTKRILIEGPNVAFEAAQCQT